MSARGTQSQIVTSIDSKASQLVSTFGGGSTEYDQVEEVKSPGLKFASSVVLTSGIEPSYALITIPIGENLDEEAPTVALVGTGPTGDVRLTSRCKIEWYDSVQKKKISVMTGSIVQYNHEVGEDTATALVMDDRWLLDKVTVWGRVRAKLDPATQTWTQWLDNSPLVFNQWGPDCVDVPGEGPRFSSDYQWGWNTNQYVEPTQGNAKTSARSWTLQDIYRYLVNLYCYGEASISQILMQGGAQINRVSSWIYAPSAMAGGADLEGFFRKKNNFSLQGKTLVAALQDVCRAAGAYDVYCEPIAGSFKSILRIVNMDPKRNSGVILKLPSVYNWSLRSISKDPAAIHSGQVSESAVNYHDYVEIIGESPWLELMCSMIPPDTEDTEEEDDLLGALILEPAWSAADEKAFKALVHELGDDKDAFITATQRYPQVYAAYRLNPQLLTQALVETKYNGWKILSYPRILPYLLTSVDGAATDATEANPNNWIPTEIKFQYWDESGYEWIDCDPQDGLKLSPERSTLMVEGLRDAKRTWKSDGGYDGETMTPNWIRATLAFELPSPLCSKSGSNANGPGDPNYTAARINYNRNKLVYTGLGIPEAKDYVEYLRHSTSRPFGVNVPDADVGAKDTAGGELFSDKPSETTGRQPRHARERLRDVKRIEYTGTINLSSFHCGLKPGTNVRIFGGGRILPISVCKSIKLDPLTQRVSVELVSHDSRVIYDNPAIAAVEPLRPAGEHPGTGNTANPSKSKADAGPSGSSGSPGETPAQQRWNQSMSQYKEIDKTQDEHEATREVIADALGGKTKKYEPSREALDAAEEE